MSKGWYLQLHTQTRPSVFLGEDTEAAKNASTYGAKWFNYISATKEW